jgi:hypothetical protein
MKKLFILLLAGSMLASCNNKKASTEKTSKDTTTNTTDVKPPSDMGKVDPTTTTSTGWPEKDRNDFLTSCVDEAVKNVNDRTLASNYCSCMLSKLEAEYPDVTKAAALTTDEVTVVMQKYRDGCLGK